MDSKTYTVTGMTCEKCEAALAAGVGELPGVTRVQIDRPAGILVLTGDPLPDDASVTRAVEDAGFQLTSDRH